MKYILLSTRPKWCEKICHEIGKDENGKAIYEKRIEVRKTAPKEVPFKAYIYCTKGKDGYEWLYRVDNNGYGKAQSWHGKVIGEFVCDKVYLIKNQGSMFSVADEEQSVTNEIARQSCLDYYDMVSYLGNKDGYGWHISDLKIYDKPKELSEFKKTKGRIARTCGMQARNGLCRAIDHEELCDNVKCCFKRPCPSQSWQYVEELTNEQRTD